MAIYPRNSVGVYNAIANSLAPLSGGTRRGAMMGGWPPLSQQSFQLKEVRQSSELMFVIEPDRLDAWEWLVNSDYKITMMDRYTVEFHEAAGAVAFKLMFCDGKDVDPAL